MTQEELQFTKNCRNVTLATHHICQADELTNCDYHITDEFCSYPLVNFLKYGNHKKQVQTVHNAKYDKRA